MGKTLIINGADFSDVSIGKVKILSETALEWIAASGNSGLTTEQKFAVDDFISAIGVGELGSLYSKIDKLWLPMLSADKAHSLVDYRNNYVTPTFDTDSQGSFDNYIEFANHGIRVKEHSDSNVPGVVVDGDYDINESACSLFIFNTVSMPSIASGTSKVHLGIGEPYPNRRLGFTQTGTALHIYWGGNSNKVIDTSSDMLACKLRGAILNNTSLKFLKANGDLSEITNPTITHTKGISIGSSANNLILGSTGVVSYGAFIVGNTVLSAEEVASLKEAVESLFDAINV